MRFNFYKVCPCFEAAGRAVPFSFNREEDFKLFKGRSPFKWALTGWFSGDSDNDIAMLLGVYDTLEEALQVQNAILAPMIEARNLLNDKRPGAYDLLYDVIAQSSDEDRL